MKAFEIFTLKRSRTSAQTAKLKNAPHDNLPDLVCSDSYSISSSSFAGSERSNGTNSSPSLSKKKKDLLFTLPKSPRVTQEIQTKLQQSMQMRRQQRNARQQRLEERLLESQSGILTREVSPGISLPSMSFLPSALKVKRKLLAVREQQIRNLLATERLMLQKVALSEQ